MSSKLKVLFSCAAVATLLLSPALVGEAEQRTWSDSKGKFSVDAELVGVDGDKVKLRKKDGSTITVAVDQLSKEDQKFVKESQEKSTTTEEPNDEKNEQSRQEIEKITTSFYEDLRTEEREVARQSLTATAIKLASNGKSPLMGLPEPDEHRRAIRVGKIKIGGKQAEAPVKVRSGGKVHDTKLHFRSEEGKWCVFAISAKFADGEKTINFEASADGREKKDPLAELVGKKLDLEGITVQGRPLDMSQFEGKIVLVDFWATWCGPCRAEIPNILANYKKYNDDGFEVIAISVDRDMAELKKFVAEEQPPWTVVADHHPRNRKPVSNRLGIRGIPALVLIGQDGKVAAVHCRGKQLEKEITKLLK